MPVPVRASTPILRLRTTVRRCLAAARRLLASLEPCAASRRLRRGSRDGPGAGLDQMKGAAGVDDGDVVICGPSFSPRGKEG